MCCGDAGAALNATEERVALGLLRCGLFEGNVLNRYNINTADSTPQVALVAKDRKSAFD